MSKFVVGQQVLYRPITEAIKLIAVVVTVYDLPRPDAEQRYVVAWYGGDRTANVPEHMLEATHD